MTKHTHHATHPDIVKRLKRANGHLLSVIGMIEAERPCTDIAQQLHAVEKAITQAKRMMKLSVRWMLIMDTLMM